MLAVSEYIHDMNFGWHVVSVDKPIQVNKEENWVVVMYWCLGAVRSKVKMKWDVFVTNVDEVDVLAVQTGTSV